MYTCILIWVGLRSYVQNSCVISDPYSSSPDQDPTFQAENQSGSRVFMTKNWKNLQLIKKCTIQYLPQASIKDVLATREAFSPQKRTSSTSKHEIFIFSICVGHFCSPRSTDLIESGSNPDPKHCKIPWNATYCNYVKPTTNQCRMLGFAMLVQCS